MRRTLHLLSAFALAALVAATAASAQDRIYVSFTDPNLRGDSTDPAHPNWIEAYGLEHGATFTGSFSYSPITFLKGVDRATPRLSWMVASGNVVSEAIIDVCREPAGGPQQCYYRLTLRDVRVAGASLAGQACIDPQGCGGSQSESIELAWTRLKWEFTNSSGETFTACFDVNTAKFSCF
jgi:type VI secretion system Hcp family effector